MGSIKLDREGLTHETAKARFNESLQDALKYALLAKEMQFEAERKETDEELAKILSMHDALM